jgi:hypothetical protein
MISDILILLRTFQAYTVKVYNKFTDKKMFNHLSTIGLYLYRKV